MVEIEPGLVYLGKSWEEAGQLLQQQEIHHLSIYLSIFLSICLSIYLFIHISVYLSICLSIYLSIYLSGFRASSRQTFSNQTIKLGVLSHIYIYVHTYIWVYLQTLIILLFSFYFFKEISYLNAFINFYKVNLHTILRQIYNFLYNSINR